MDSQDDWVEISLVNIPKGNNRVSMPVKPSKNPGDGMMLEYVPCQYNYIGSKYTKYFTPCIISELDQHGFTKSKYINFHNKNHVEVFLAECLVCGGRAFFGMNCKKCNQSKYNLGIGVCNSCGSTGVLGIKCAVCLKDKAENLPIKCINPSAGTVCTTEDRSNNKYWYNTVQRSFDHETRELNMVKRYKAERAARAKYILNSNLLSEPLMYPRPFNAISNLSEAHQLITGSNEQEYDEDDLMLEELLDPKEDVAEKLDNLEIEPISIKQRKSSIDYSNLIKLSWDETDKKLHISENQDTYETNMFQTERSSEGLDLKTCVLLDSGSTVHAFCNKNLLEKIWKAPRNMTLTGNGGSITTNQLASIKISKCQNQFGITLIT